MTHRCGPIYTVDTAFFKKSAMGPWRIPKHQLQAVRPTPTAATTTPTPGHEKGPKPEAGGRGGRIEMAKTPKTENRKCTRARVPSPPLLTISLPPVGPRPVGEALLRSLCGAMSGKVSRFKLASRVVSGQAHGLLCILPLLLLAAAIRHVRAPPPARLRG